MYFQPIYGLDKFVDDEALKYRLMKIYAEEMTAIHFG